MDGDRGRRMGGEVKGWGGIWREREREGMVRGWRDIERGSEEE